MWPVEVFEHLPDTHPMKKDALEIRAAYQKSEGNVPTDTLWAYSFDAWTIYLDAAQRALASKAEPGTAQFRLALRDALVGTRGVGGAHSGSNFKTTGRYGSRAGAGRAGQ